MIIKEQMYFNDQKSLISVLDKPARHRYYFGPML